MTRITLAVVLTAAGVTALVHHHKRPAPVSSATLAPVLDLPRVSRNHPRLPLRPSTPPIHGQGATPRPVPNSRRPSRPAGAAAAHLSDVTMYCATGNRNADGRWPRLGDVAVADRSIPFGTNVIIAGRSYTAEDWIGTGSQFDIFGGDDDGCEQRAISYGRHHLEVVVER